MLELFKNYFDIVLPHVIIYIWKFMVHILLKPGLENFEHCDCKEIQPVHSEGDQPRVFIGRNGAEAETPVLWPPHANSLKKTLMWEGLRAGREGDHRG